MPFRLKPSENAFQVTREGKFEYRRYEHGKVYDEIPPEDAHRFEKKQSAERIAHSEETKKTKK
jgi:hypothetical protein